MRMASWWSTVRMARHYTGALTAEDRRAADHIGGLFGAGGIGEKPRRSAVRHPTRPAAE